MADYGIRISRKGADVKNCPNSDIIFDSRNRSLKILQAHQIYVPPEPGGTGPIFNRTIKHGLNYFPAVLRLYKQLDPDYSFGDPIIQEGWVRGVDESVSWDKENIYLSTTQYTYGVTHVIFIVDIDLENDVINGDAKDFAGFDSPDKEFGIDCTDVNGNVTFSTRYKQLSPVKISRMAETAVAPANNYYSHAFGKIPLYSHFKYIASEGRYRENPDVIGDYAVSTAEYVNHTNASPWFPASKGVVIFYGELV